MSEELAELKGEVERLRRDVDHLLRVLGQEAGEGARPEFLLLEAEVIFIRHSGDRIPIVIKAQEGNAAVYLNDNEGRARGVFQIDDEGSARLEIWNKDQQVVVSIGETREGAGEIYVAAADGKPRAGLKVTDFGGMVSAQSPDGRINAVMIGKGDGGTMIVADEQGRPVVEITPVNGQGTIAVKHGSGGHAVVLGSDEGGGTITFFDREGKPKQSLAEKISSLRELVTRKKQDEPL